VFPQSILLAFAFNSSSEPLGFFFSLCDFLVLLPLSRVGNFSTQVPSAHLPLFSLRSHPYVRGGVSMSTPPPPPLLFLPSLTNGFPPLNCLYTVLSRLWMSNHICRRVSFLLAPDFRRRLKLIHSPVSLDLARFRVLPFARNARKDFIPLP